jgi:hypothetical protein
MIPVIQGPRGKFVASLSGPCEIVRPPNGPLECGRRAVVGGVCIRHGGGELNLEGRCCARNSERGEKIEVNLEAFDLIATERKKRGWS